MSALCTDVTMDNTNPEDDIDLAIPVGEVELASKVEIPRESTLELLSDDGNVGRYTWVIENWTEFYQNSNGKCFSPTFMVLPALT